MQFNTYGQFHGGNVNTIALYLKLNYCAKARNVKFICRLKRGSLL
jgi:hypothetical protein